MSKVNILHVGDLVKLGILVHEVPILLRIFNSEPKKIIERKQS